MEGGRRAGSRDGRSHVALRREWRHLLMVVPAALLLLLFFMIPAGWALWTSLTDRALLGFGAMETRFVGLDNFRYVFGTPDFPKIVRNTLVFVAGTAILGQTALGFALALLLHLGRRKRSRLVPVAYAAVLVAWISPPAFAGTIWAAVLEFPDGVLNTVLESLGFEPFNMLWEYPMLSVIIAEIWRGAAFPTVIFLGALQTVPLMVYEAAELDGAGAWRRFRDITLPIMTHLLAIVLLLTTITAMGSFLLIAILTNGEPGYGTETIALFAFHRAFVTYQIGVGASIAVVMLVLNLLFAVVYLRIARVEE